MNPGLLLNMKTNLKMKKNAFNRLNADRNTHIFKIHIMKIS